MNNICECYPKEENYKFRFYYIECKNNNELKYIKDIVANNIFEAQNIFQEQYIFNSNRNIKVLAIKKFILEDEITKTIEVFNMEGEIK